MLISYWENSGITRYVIFLTWQKLNILQNDVIKLECVVEYCNINLLQKAAFMQLRSAKYKTLDHVWKKLNIQQNDVIKLECAVEYCNTADSSVEVVIFIHNADVNTGSIQA